MKIDLVRTENIDRENRGFVLDKVEAVVDGEVVGYLKIENIPGAEFRKYYPTIFNYLSQIQGRNMLPFRQGSVHYRDLDDDALVKMLTHQRPYFIADKKDFAHMDRAALLAAIRSWEKRLLKGQEGKDFAFFRAYHVDKPFVAYIHVERHARRQGIATALYIEGAHWCRERGLCFRASKTQTAEAQSVWARFIVEGKTRRDVQGRYILYPDGAPRAMAKAA